MILILSKSDLELSTEEISDWLQYYGEAFIRINARDLRMADYFFKISNEEESCFTDLLCTSEINVVWYRRWSDHNHSVTSINPKYKVLEQSINRHRNQETSVLGNFIFAQLQDKVWVSKPTFNHVVTKQEMLDTANKVGLSVPSTIITTSKNALKSFFDTYKQIVIKPISDADLFFLGDKSLSNYTSSVTEIDLMNMPDKFHPALFQEQVDKLYELRIFYWFGKFYSMAIFSQNDEQTTVDFRKYNYVKPNRNVPYNLPVEVKNKLKKLMKILKYSNGSIDLIRGKNGEYIFLEVNPIGQFGMTSYPCNYYIEKEIAQKLIYFNNIANEKKENTN